MASGWAKDGAVQEQIDASVAEAVQRARSQMTSGDGLEECEECGENIPQARRMAVPGVRRCLGCQEAQDQQLTVAGSFNRRASKDSQLR